MTYLGPRAGINQVWGRAWGTTWSQGKHCCQAYLCGRQFTRSGGHREDSRSAMWPGWWRWPGNGFEPASSSRLWPPIQFSQENKLSSGMLFFFFFFVQNLRLMTGMETEQWLWWSDDPGPCELANWKDNQGEVSNPLPPRQALPGPCATVWRHLPKAWQIVQVRIWLVSLKNEQGCGRMKHRYLTFMDPNSEAICRNIFCLYCLFCKTSFDLLTALRSLFLFL